jgi:hypothetical protein
MTTKSHHRQITIDLFPWLISDILDEQTHSNGVGIVICIWKPRGVSYPVESAYRTIDTIRKVFRSTLPIEVFHLGDLGVEEKRRFEYGLEGVTCRDLRVLFDVSALNLGMLKSF